MISSVGANAPPAVQGARRLPRIDQRYLAPLLITCVLVVGQITFGFLESWSRTFLAIATAILTELVVVRAVYGKWPHLASAYVSGISVGILVRSPAFWPYALCAAISIVSKYVLRVRGRHIWNPTNFGVVAMLLLAPDVVVRHKTGTLGIGVANDVGIIDLPNGAGHLALAIFVKESSRPADAQDRAIAQIARAAYDYFLFNP